MARHNGGSSSARNSRPRGKDSHSRKSASTTATTTTPTTTAAVGTTHPETIRRLPGDFDSDDSENDDDQDSSRSLFTNKDTMMANFEEWIKMATDNKINSKNSWNFALIDYFHDLNVLKDLESGGINFQKASATLDGCMKIYASRVDSVASETGKLLSGLANDKNSKNRGDSENANGDNDGADKDNEVIIDEATGLPINNVDLEGDDQRRRRKNLNRVLETTLTEFKNIKLKQLDEELAIDPIFKKALSEFDEAGAKSLLLNTLHVEEDGRVVFDAMGAAGEETVGEKQQHDENVESVLGVIPEVHADVEKLAITDSLVVRIDNSMDEDNDDEDVDMDSQTNISVSTPNTTLPMTSEVLSKMDDDILLLGNSIMMNISSKMLCPSMGFIKDSLEGKTTSKDLALSSSDTVTNDQQTNSAGGFLTEHELQDVFDEDPIANLSFANMDMNDDGDIDDGDIGAPDELSNKELLGPLLTDDSTNTDVHTKNGSGVVEEEKSVLVDMDLLAQIDQNMKKSWRGREHWKVEILKKTLSKDNQLSTSSVPSAQLSTEQAANIGENNNDGTTIETVGLPKLNTINFFDFEDDFEDTVFGTNDNDSSKKSKPRINLPLNSREHEDHHLLPNDFHFTTDKITRLFIKPTARMSFFTSGSRSLINNSDSVNMGNRENIDGDNISGPPQLADEQFWADQYENIAKNEIDELQESIRDGNNSNDNDDNMGEDMGFDFNYAFEDNALGNRGDGDNNDNSNNINKTEDVSKMLLAPAGLIKTDLDINEQSQLQKFSTMSNSNIPEIKYSRVSKKVDVKKLKDNIWRSIQSLLIRKKESVQNDDDNSEKREEEESIELLFTAIVRNLRPLYGIEAFNDISTSFCFICLLHLANEHGFIIKNNSLENYTDLTLVMQRDM